ncbi:MAG: polymer-forming cytoskeletal protein [Gammaproteobacteria bacterium]|nr:polymer-forming cytoskeletal protein [Gammaproteobacteria bacterium]MDH4255441.1 polymer-forming cytoskeletal protein [Gammaproteobacteria bacterium]MDH5311752.1 polymer-forming cytoskeletal protein [Gammaproteobacteria bacterium]
MANSEITNFGLNDEPHGDNEQLTESQVIAFSDAARALRPPAEQKGEHPVSVIGETLHFKGELSAGEDLVIEGTVEGTVNQGKCCLTVMPKGTLRANVNATKIFIDGRVEGDLSATVSVTIRESGIVTGNIVAPKVSIHEGATFNGSIAMRAPKGDAGK